MSDQGKWNIKWIKSDRFDRVGRFSLAGTPGEIFPLLCPVLEYAWLPGWSCRMAYSRSGTAEKDCVFFTNEDFGRTALWTLITYEPDTFIEYLVTSGKDAVMRLSIALEGQSGGKTAVTWTMRFTACSLAGRFILKRRFSESNFNKMMRDREKELNWYLKHKTMIAATGRRGRPAPASPC